MGIQKMVAYEIIKVLKNGKKRTRILFETPELAQAYIDTYKKGKNYTYEKYEFPHVYGTLEDIEQDILESSLNKKIRNLERDMMKIPYPIVCEGKERTFEIVEIDYESLFTLLSTANEYEDKFRQGEDQILFPYEKDGDFVGTVSLTFNEYKMLVQLFFDRKIQIGKLKKEKDELSENEKSIG